MGALNILSAALFACFADVKPASRRAATADRESFSMPLHRP
jgi:hypothetical protein